MRTDVKKSPSAAATKHRVAAEVVGEMLLVEVPPPNDCLNEDGQFWWNYYCGLMIESNILSRYYIPFIHNLCLVLQTIEVYQQKLMEQGYFIDVPKTYKGEEYYEEVMNPIYEKLSKAIAQADSLGNSLGFTPFAAKVQGTDTGSGSNQAPVAPPALPTDLPSPETLPFSQAQ